MLNQLLALVAAAGVLWLLTVTVLCTSHQRPRPAPVAIVATPLSLMAVSLMAVTPLLAAGALSLAWAGIYLVLAAVLLLAGSRPLGRPAYLGVLVAMAFASYGATGAWPYLAPTPTLLGCLVVLLGGVALGAAPAPIPRAGRTRVLAAVLVAASLLAGVPQVLDNLSSVGLDYLVVAQGSSASVQPLTLVLALGTGVAAAFYGFRSGSTWSSSCFPMPQWRSQACRRSP
jgi:hypothetical protein